MRRRRRIIINIYVYGTIKLFFLNSENQRFAFFEKEHVNSYHFEIKNKQYILAISKPLFSDKVYNKTYNVIFTVLLYKIISQKNADKRKY